MIERLAYRVAIPMVIISLLLLGLGGAAAWNVQKQQVTTQNLIVNEIEGLLATQQVYMRTREILNLLHQFRRTHDQNTLKSIGDLQADTLETLRRARQWPRTPEEGHLMDQISHDYGEFWYELGRARGIESLDQRNAAVDELAEGELTNRIIDSAELYIGSGRAVVARANEASQYATDLTRQGFLLLGLCGCAGGLIAGWGMSRAIQHSLVRLEISVRGVADRLGAVAGPVTFTQEGGLRELESGLVQMEDHIVSLVERLQQSELQMLRSEQLAAMGQLSAGLAHELRNPLMPIKTLVQTAIERGDERGLSGKALHVIDQEIQRLEQSIQTFLEFARPNIPAKTTFDLVDRIQQSLELVSVRARQQGIEIHCALPDSPVLIEADAGQIQQVVLNLLLNAIDAMSEGGTIDVAVSPVQQPGGDKVRLEIADSGPGICDNVLAHIFDPFMTTKETGTGLGLSICRQLIEAHGGTIDAANRAAGGAVFTVILPLHVSGHTADLAIAGGQIDRP